VLLRDRCVRRFGASHPDDSDDGRNDRRDTKNNKSNRQEPAGFFDLHRSILAQFLLQYRSEEAMSRFLSTFVCAALLTMGCGSNPNEPDPAFPVTLTLQAGSSQITGGLMVKFVEVTQDSRCPINAMCIVAGDATVQLEFATDRRFASQLLQAVDPKKRTASFDGYSIEVKELYPYPDTTKPFNKADYKVTIAITR
jgi:hypothetical protein